MSDDNTIKIDIVQVRKDVVGWLRQRGFELRDADPSDFARPGDSSLRFKVGTSRGEVTIQVWLDGRARKQPVRILTEKGKDAALAALSSMIEEHDRFESHGSLGPKAQRGRVNQ